MTLVDIEHCLAEHGIEPHHVDEAGLIYCGDCMDILPLLPEGCVDLVLTDPPYGLKRFKKGIGKNDRHSVKSISTDFNNNKPSKELLKNILGIGREHIIWGMNNFDLPTTEYYFVWNKMQTVDNFASAELAWTDIKCPAKVFNYAIHSHNQTVRVHPTQKPRKLMTWCISFSKTKGIILDPYLGSGTTAVAAKQLGRKFIGIEISEKYCEIAKQRLAQHELFAQTKGNG